MGYIIAFTMSLLNQQASHPAPTEAATAAEELLAEQKPEDSQELRPTLEKKSTPGTAWQPGKSHRSYGTSGPQTLYIIPFNPGEGGSRGTVSWWEESPVSP